MSWNTIPLNDLCSKVVSGGTPSTKVPSYYDGHIPWLRTQEVKFNFIYDTEIKITEDGFNNSSAKWVPENSVIVAMYGNSAGRVGINKIPLTTNQACCNLTIDENKADYRFVYYSLLKDYEILHQMAKGSAQNNLNAGMIKNYKIKIPPLAEQKLIASTLSGYDELIENNLRRIDLLEEAAQILYKEWFINLRFPGYEHSIKSNGLPEKWEQKTIGDVIELKYGKALIEDNRIEGKYPVYGSSGIVGYHNEPLVEGPGIIVGRKGNVGSVFWSYTDFYPIDTAYYAEPSICKYYSFYCLKNKTFQSSDAAVPGLNRNYAYSLPILIPSKEILGHFKKNVEPIRKMINQLTIINEKLVQGRNILIQKLLNGET